MSESTTPPVEPIEAPVEPVEKPLPTFVIQLVGVSKCAGPRRCGDFVAVAALGGHVYKGRDYPLSEFNDLVPKVMEQYKTYMPMLPKAVIIFPKEEKPAPQEEAPLVESDQQPPTGDPQLPPNPDPEPETESESVTPDTEPETPPSGTASDDDVRALWKGHIDPGKATEESQEDQDDSDPIPPPAPDEASDVEKEASTPPPATKKVAKRKPATKKVAKTE